MHITTHDTPTAADLAIVDAGLDAANAEAAPLHEVRPLAAFARDDDGTVFGGVVGRTWGDCCELQQLWVADERRGTGIGGALLATFEREAIDRGCTRVFLESFSFQAPRFYESRGYVATHRHDAYPHGIVRTMFVKNVRA